ncbi:BTA121 domain-containing protein surface lipoprotein [Borrelia persica]|uniref:BTA121 domain-containing protein surface lipoprotein n=1 Tax=Borrelia persica TaxID=44448 RepID=UPI0004653A67
MFGRREYNSLLVLLLVLIVGCNLKSPKSDDSLEKNFNEKEKDDDLGLVLESGQLKDLLSMFMMSNLDKKLILHIREIVTDSNLHFPGYKTYTKDEFYLVLRDLGRENVLKLVASNASFRALKESEEAVAALKSDYALQRLMSELKEYKRAYFLSLKEAFDRFVADKNKVYDDVMIENHASNFKNLEEQARHVMVFESCYGALLDEDKQVIENVRGILTNADIGVAEEYKTYDNYEFTILFGKLNNLRFGNVIRIFSENLQAFREARDKIANVIMSDRKFVLQRKLDACESDYYLNVKRAFDSGVVDDVYAKFISVSSSIIDSKSGVPYSVVDFCKGLENHAVYINAYQLFFRNLAGERQRAVDFIRNVLTKSVVFDNLKVYKDYEFEALFGNKNFAVDEIIDEHLYTLAKRDEVGRIISGIKDVSERKDNKTKYDDLVSGYLEYLRRLFNNFDPISVSVENINHDYASQFVKLGAYIRQQGFINKVYNTLSPTQSDMFEEILGIVTNPDIGAAEELKTYQDYEVFDLFGDDRFDAKMFIDSHKDISLLEKQIKREIDGLPDGEKKADLKKEFDTLALEYKLHLKSLFHGIAADNVPTILEIDNSFLKQFNSIKNRVQKIKHKRSIFKDI